MNPSAPAPRHLHAPIKALSNQKYRDFSLKYGAANVGILTGM
jgi:superfamily II RNA helicase